MLTSVMKVNDFSFLAASSKGCVVLCCQETALPENFSFVKSLSGASVE